MQSRIILSYGKVQNKSGEFVKADLKSVTAAAAAAKTMPADLRVSITDESGSGVYPISTYTWLLVPSNISDANKQKALVGFLKWADHHRSRVGGSARLR